MCDTQDFAKLRTVIKDGVGVVYHFVALSSHRNALERPLDYLKDLMGTANVLEAARFCNPTPLVFLASSNKVYGKQECPWREDNTPKPEGPYALEKITSEQMCEMYDKYFGVRCVVVRYHHVAGKRSNPELVLSIFTELAIKGIPLEVHGRFDKDGEFTSCSADYTHVDDAIRATILAADNYKGFDVFNIANEKLTLVSHIAEEVKRLLDSKSVIVNVPMLPHETLVHHSDISKAEEKLRFVAEIPVEVAIKEYIEWRLK